MKQLKLGLIGLGRIGRLHADCISRRLDRAKLVHAADPVAATRQCLPEQVRFSLDASELIANPEVEAVLICSATETHAPLIEEAARSGKHIFCEKPIDLDPERIRRALAVVERAGLKLQIGFNRRFDANFVTIKRGIADGEIGQPHFLRICSRDPAPPPLAYLRESGGIFFDMMIHDLDMARFLFGEIESVQAQVAVLIDEQIGELGDFDTAVACLRFANGALGVIDNSRQAAYGYDQRVEAFGSQGMLKCDNSFPHSVHYFNNQGSRGPLPHHFFLERYQQAYVDELHAFVLAVLEDQDVPVTGIDGLRSVELAEAALASIRQSSQSVVS